MDLGGTTWIVAVDGLHARVFEERLRAGEVRELPARRMRAEESERPRAHRHMATVHERMGHGRHGAGERTPSEELERRFLRRVAGELEIFAERGDYDAIVLMAPPRALGVLKAELAPAVAARLQGTDPHERTRDDAEMIRAHLRHVRARA